VRLSATARASSLPEVPAPRSGADRRASGNDLCSVPSGLPGGHARFLDCRRRPGRRRRCVRARGCGAGRQISFDGDAALAAGAAARPLGHTVYNPPRRMRASASVASGRGPGSLGCPGPSSRCVSGPIIGIEGTPQPRLPRAPRVCCAVPKVLEMPPVAEAPNGNSVPDHHQTTLNSSGIAPCPTHRKGLWPSRY
jgi:hypothetical protein